MRYGEIDPKYLTGLSLPGPTTLGEHILVNWLTGAADEVEPTWQTLLAALRSASIPSMAALVEYWRRTSLLASLTPMALLHALQLLDPADQRDGRVAIDALALAGPRSRAMVKSLFAEQQLTVLDWAHLLDALSKPSRAPVDSLRAWGNEHRLQGSSCPAPMPLGRVIEKNSFVKSLMTHARLPRQVARDTMVDLGSTTQWIRARDAVARKAFQLGGDVMWGTFDVHGGDPFGFAATAQKRGHYIKASLGLERDPVPQRRYLPVMLLRYSTTAECHAPTCADAAKYEDWNIYFAPAVDRCPGLTQPWDESDIGLEPRPEVVHSQVDASALCAPLEEVR